MTRYAKHVNKRQTPQTEKAHKKQRQNSAGGFSFVLDNWARLDRWLILGADGGTYYASESKLTKDNAAAIEACLNENGVKTVERVVEVSQAGRAPKNDPAIFALAMAAGHSDSATRKAALAAIPQVCRTGTHLFSFIDSVKSFRGWGRGLRQAVMQWYVDRKPDNLAYQVVKYQQRNGVSHRDVLRLAGGALSDMKLTPEQETVFRWIVAGMDMGERRVERKNGPTKVYPALDPERVPGIIQGWEAMKRATTVREATKLITEFGLTHEMVKNDFKSDPAIWVALLENMPITACLRNVGRMTANGTLKPMSKATKQVVKLLTDPSRIKRGRVHPLAYLMALKTYAGGHGVRGSLSWSPIAAITDALDEGYYLAFGAIEPSGKRELLALDVSGSMGWGQIAGMPGIMPRDGAAAMAMATARTESDYHIMGFSHQLVDINISKRDRLDAVISKTSRIPMGGTDCSLPMQWAMQNKVEVDTFRVYTDNETWARRIHPHQALEQYRQRMGIPAKLIVVGMTASDVTIANPDDPGMLDVVGFDTAAPNIMNDFSREGYGS